jgi:hypothetical protein
VFVIPGLSEAESPESKGKRYNIGAGFQARPFAKLTAAPE